MAMVLLHQGAAARCAQLLQSEDATSRSTAAEALGRHSAYGDTVAHLCRMILFQ